MPSIIKTNNANIVWGTEGAHSTLKVKSVRRSSRSETIPFADGNGFTNATVTIADGDDYEITAHFDSGNTRPAEGDVLTLSFPGDGSPIKCQVVATSQSASEKARLELSISAKTYAGITLS